MRIKGITRKNFFGVLLGLLITGIPLVSAIPVSAADNTSVTVSPSSRAVGNGANFTVDLVVNSTTAIRGWQTDVNFDALKVQCTAVTEGSFLRTFAQANSASTYWVAPKIDNTSGKITNAMCAMMGAPNARGATGSGTLCTLTFTAKSVVSGTCKIAPVNVMLADANTNLFPVVVINAANIAIGNTSNTPVVPPPSTQINPTTTPTTTTPAPTTPYVIPPLTAIPRPTWTPLPILPSITTTAKNDGFTIINAPMCIDTDNQKGTVPSGSIIRSRSDGITEVFNSEGNLLYRALDCEAKSIVTPGGVFPATHIFQYPPNAVIDTRGNVTEIYVNNILILTMVSGDIPNTLPPSVPVSTATNSVPSVNQQTNPSPMDQNTVNPHIENAYQEAEAISEFAAYWNVPKAPAQTTDIGMRNYIWNGLETNNPAPGTIYYGLLQPVLMCNNKTDGWTGATYYCVNGQYLESQSVINVNVGDQIVGVISFISGNQWRIQFIDTSTGQFVNPPTIYNDFGPSGFQGANPSGLVPIVDLEGWDISGNDNVCSSVNFTALDLTYQNQQVNNTWSPTVNHNDQPIDSDGHYDYFSSLTGLGVNLLSQPNYITLLTANGLNISGSTSCYPVIANALGVSATNGIGSSGPYQNTSNGEGLIAQVVQGDSDVGLANLFNHSSNVAMFDRPLTAIESQMYSAYPIARDGVCMIVSSSVPSNIIGLTLLQIRGIYEGVYVSGDGYEYWDAASVTPSSGPDAGILFPGLGGNSHVRIAVYAGDIGAGSRDFLGSTCGFYSPPPPARHSSDPGSGLYYASVLPLEETFIGQEGPSFRVGSDSNMNSTVNNANGAIGYVSYAFDSGTNIRALKTVDSSGSAWSPLAMNIYGTKPPANISPAYPLTHLLYLVTAGSNNQGIADFVSWMIDKNYSQGQDAVYNTVNNSQHFLTITPDQDVSIDDVVDVLDIISVGNHVGETGYPHFNRADVTRDGRVDVLDLVAVGNWVGLHIMSY